jgi:nucleoside-triphosphatase THEP1
MNILLTGERNAGKTTVVRAVVSRLHDREITTAGFYTAGGPETLELVAARTGERRVFATQSGEFDGPTVGRYTVDPAAIEWGLALADDSADVLVLDEIGALERRGEGFAPLLSDLEPSRYHGILVAVRKGGLEFVADAFPAESPVERLEVTPANRTELPGRIVGLLTDESG